MSAQVVMAHTNHRLTFMVIDGEPQVIMSSPRGEYLRTVTAAAIHREEHAAGRRIPLRRLNRIDSELRGLNEDWHAAQGKSDTEKRSAINRRLGQIADNLRSLGKEFGIEDLEHLGHASRYVEGNRLVPPWDTDIRRWFYPSGYLTATDTWRAAELRLRHPTDRNLFRDESTTPHSYEPIATATIDHKPRVVEHWNTAGNNTVPVVRRDFYNDVQAAHLQLVAGKNNSSDGAVARAMGARFHPTVGKDFRGPDDET